MAVEPAELIKSDQDHLIHPLHHPSDHLERNATVAKPQQTCGDGGSRGGIWLEGA